METNAIEAKTVSPKDVSFTRMCQDSEDVMATPFKSNNGIAASLIDEYEENRQAYQALSSLRTNMRELTLEDNGVNPLLFTYPAAVASIQTPMSLWHPKTVEFITGDMGLGENAVANYMAETQDGDVKTEKVPEVLSTSILPQAYKALKRGDVHEAMEILAGQRHDKRTYLRYTKAAFPLWLCGFDVMCIDTNIADTLGYVWDWYAGQREVTHHNMKHANANGNLPSEWQYYGQQMTNNGTAAEYDRFGKLAIETIHQATMERGSEIPRKHIPQVAFNVGGNWDKAYIHKPVFEAIGETVNNMG